MNELKENFLLIFVVLFGLAGFVYGMYRLLNLEEDYSSVKNILGFTAFVAGILVLFAAGYYWAGKPRSPVSVNQQENNSQIELTRVGAGENNERTI